MVPKFRKYYSEQCRRAFSRLTSLALSQPNKHQRGRRNSGTPRIAPNGNKIKSKSQDQKQDQVPRA